MREVHARIAERYARKRGRPHGLLTCFAVCRVVDGTFEVVAEQPHGFPTSEIAPRVRALTHGSKARAAGSRPADERPCGERFQRVREHVEPRAGDDLSGQGVGAVGVDKGFGRTQRGRGDAGLGRHGQQIEDGDAGHLAAGARRRRAGDVRSQRSRHRRSVTDRSVDVGQEVGRVGGVQVGGLGGIDHRAAADRHIAIGVGLRRECRCPRERFIRRFDVYLGIADDVDARRPQGMSRRVEDLQRGHIGIGEQRHSGHAESPCAVAEFLQAAPAEGDPGCVNRERRVQAIPGGLIMTAAHRASPCLRMSL